MTRPLILAAALVLALRVALPGFPQLPEDVTSERNPGKRSEIAIDAADRLIDQVRAYYKAGRTDRAKEELDLISRLADECLRSTQEAHKSKYWKRSELKVAALTRRVQSLAQELDYTQRDDANKVAVHLDAIHDKLLAGVMQK
jgi:hypothetical protein